MRFRFPDRKTLLEYLASCGAGYWPQNQSQIYTLDIRTAPWPDAPVLEYTAVPLPNWAADLGVNGSLLAPAHCVTSRTAGPDDLYQSVDWWQTAFLLLSCWEEAQWEDQRGPVHSYAFRLKTVDSRIWDHAWVNRIFLLLRRWAARSSERSESDLFGDLPHPVILMTHDIDAVSKTLSIRAKWLAFAVFNSLRHCRRGEWARAWRKLLWGTRFSFSRADYWCFPRIRELERSFGIASQFYVYAGSRKLTQTATRLLFDPGYQIGRDPRLAQTLRELRAEGCNIGAHPSFGAWAYSDVMREERRLLEEAVGFPVTSCRQHWLRFSFRATWSEQAKAGFREDYTLGFNDRPAFRCAAALRIRPWWHEESMPHDLESVPLILMDSHVYDYEQLDESQRYHAMARWIQEIKDVHGTASVLWHQQVLGSDYHWEQGLVNLLGLIRGGPAVGSD